MEVTKLSDRVLGKMDGGSCPDAGVYQRAHWSQEAQPIPPARTLQGLLPVKLIFMKMI